MFFANDSTGWIVEGSRIALTTNGGDTWFVGYSFGGNSIDFYDDQHGFVSGAGDMTYITSDGGLSWDRKGSSFTSGDLDNAFFVNTATGWINETLDASFLSTEDGGLNWTRLITPVDFTNHFFIDSENGWGIRGETVHKTSDGGLSWVSHHTGFSFSLKSPFFVDDLHGWVVGDFGSILKTTDGGEIWEYQFSGTDETLRDVEFVDLVEGWAVGDRGTIVHTTDGGTSWSLQPSGTVETLYDIDCVSSDLCWVGTGRSPTSVLRTLDGGTSWSIIDVGGNGNIVSVSFADESNGWLLDDWDGTIIHTTDGGQLWYEQTRVALELTSVSFIDKNTGWAVGLDGTILKTTNGGVTPVEPTPPSIPQGFTLYQNYPNPFNPSTTIRFELPRSVDVSLKVFNLLGQEVATLISGHKDAGTHMIHWDATGHPSGVYFYRLRAGEFVETRKLVLIK